MATDETYVPSVGDFVTVDHWINSNDRSYTTDVFTVKAVDGPLVAVLCIIGHEGWRIVLSLNRCALRPVTPEFVRAAQGFEQ